MNDNQLLEGPWHCGAVKLHLPAMPKTGRLCNCSICRRFGALFAYYDFGTVKIAGHPKNTQEYVQGARTIRIIRCQTCGCVTHWEPIDPTQTRWHGVNLTNFPPALLERINVRRFDGADTQTWME